MCGFFFFNMINSFYKSINIMEKLLDVLEYTKPWLLTNGLKIVGIAIAFYVVHKTAIRVVEKLIRKIVKKNDSSSDDAETKREDTLIRIFHGTIHVIVWVVATLMILSEIGLNVAPLVAGAGVVGLAFGFGGQYLIRDIITGLFIILENQYRVGDSVEIGGLSGKVEDISLRVTVLRDLDGVVHHIPHGEITTVSNKTKGVSKINLDFGIAYESDIDKAIEMINKVGEGMLKDFPNQITVKPEFLRVNELGDSAVVLKIVGETIPGEQFSMAGELRKRLKQAADKDVISIPYPQMMIHKA